MRIPRTTLEQWAVLQAIVDHGGFAQAADHLHRSQSSVSYMVSRLQEQVGVDLLVMVGRKARLTDHGKALLRSASELLAGAHRLEHTAASLRQGWESEIGLAVDVAFPKPLLLRALARFTQSVTQTRVQLREVVLSGADEALLDQGADIVIGTRVPSQFLGKLLIDVEFIAVAHPDHALFHLGRALTMDDLRLELQIVARDSGTSKPRDDGWLGAAQRWTVTSMETSADMVASGLGFAWLPRHVIQPMLDTGRVAPLPLTEGGTRRVPLYLVSGKPGQIGPAARELSEILQDCVRGVSVPYPASAAAS